MRREVILILGGDEEIGLHYFSLIETQFSDYVAVQAAHGKKLPGVTEEQYLHLIRGQELVQIKDFLGKRRLAGVVNRVDSYIPLQGKLVDEFGVFGSGLDQVMCFKNKWNMHQLMMEMGLEPYRPEAELVLLADLATHLRERKLPVVVKPYVGTKSRGVFVVDDAQVVGRVVGRLKEHFESRKMFRTFRGEEQVLVEEYIEGKQLTFTGIVDERGELMTVGFEDVMTGREVGQGHQQLVYRTAPSVAPEGVKEMVVKMLERLVREAGLRSTFIFPEFKVRGERVILIELNVRIGGFRSEMYEYALGMDLRKLNVNLALGRQVKLGRTEHRSCTAVEVWEDKSGVVREVALPASESVVGARVYFEAGEKYVAPPEEQEPLARFYVVDEKDSLELAKKLRRRVKVVLD